MPACCRRPSGKTSLAADAADVRIETERQQRLKPARAAYPDIIVYQDNRLCRHFLPHVVHFARILEWLAGGSRCVQPLQFEIPVAIEVHRTIFLVIPDQHGQLSIGQELFSGYPTYVRMG